MTPITPACWLREGIKLVVWWDTLMAEFTGPMPQVMCFRTHRMWAVSLATWVTLSLIPMPRAMFLALTMWVDLQAMRVTSEAPMPRAMSQVQVRMWAG